MLVPNLIVINYPKPTTGANALTPPQPKPPRRHVTETAAAQSSTPP
jgi:hypothetical protein